MCSVKRKLDVLARGLSDFGDRLAGRWSQVDAVLSVSRRQPLATDEVFVPRLHRDDAPRLTRRDIFHLAHSFRKVVGDRSQAAGTGPDCWCEYLHPLKNGRWLLRSGEGPRRHRRTARRTEFPTTHRGSIARWAGRRRTLPIN